MDSKNIKYTAVICCAGNSQRYKGNKLLEQVGNKFIFEHSVTPFLEDERCDQIILVVSYNWHTGAMLDLMKSGKVSWVHGRTTRTNSTKEGVLGARNNYVFIHDGCRPLITITLIDKLICSLLKDKNVVGVAPFQVINDLVIDDKDEVVSKPKAIMTPQLYKTKELKKVFSLKKDSETYRDTSTLVASKGEKISYIPWCETNIKLTTKSDLDLIVSEIKKRESKACK